MSAAIENSQVSEVAKSASNDRTTSSPSVNGLSKIDDSQRFARILNSQSVRPEQATVLIENKSVLPSQSQVFQKIESGLTEFSANWHRSQHLLNRKISQLPADQRELIQLQTEMSKLQLQTQLITVVGETVSSTVKRVQQMGNN